MNLSFNNIKKVFSSKIILQMYFVFFILINIFDFFNYLSGDIDFFKKILSWILIGYVFYKASFSKIFVGVIDRRFDWLFMIGFIFIGIMKSLYHYISISNINDFFVFKWFFSLFPKSSEVFLTYSFLLGIFIVILTSIILLKTHKPVKKSLIGSFELSPYLKFIGSEYFILSSSALFFGLIVFNYIMEWFALAVDSIILVLGLIFYLFMFLHHHTDLRTGNILSVISNTGNKFYQNLISQFSNKKTFMIGVSFILVLHLLVDIGVYLIPFLTGLKNTLYGSFVVDSIPIFNLVEFTESLFYLDLVNVGFEPISSISLFLIHISSIVLFGLLMFLPFYYFYKNISFKEVKLSKFVEVLFLVTLFIQLLVLVMPSLSNPISMDWDLNSQIIGVDLNSSVILAAGNSAPVELIIILILSLFLVIESRYLIKSSINEFVSKKVISSVILGFFFVYILVFGVTTMSNEFENTLMKDRVSSEGAEFDAIMNLYVEQNKDYRYKNSMLKQETQNHGVYDISFIPFSTYDYKNPEIGHIDYLIYNISNINSKYKFEIINQKTNAVFDGKYSRVSKYFNDGSFIFIYNLGENKFEFTNNNKKSFRLIKTNFDNYKIIELSDKSKMTTTIEFVRLVILFVFYFAGLMTFTSHFFKSNIRSRKEKKIKFDN
jgi:hypothetical protein